jgi:spermidine synthase
VLPEATLTRYSADFCMRDRVDLFVASVLVLFLELACIRWFPAHVLFLTFFTNVMLLASFLGISVGCLAARRRDNYLTWTPALLVLALGVAQFIEWKRHRTGGVIDVGNQLSPQLVFFGVDFQPWDPSKFAIPIEAISGALFVLVALILVGPGQQLGRSLTRLPNRIEAYTLNIAGSVAGILLFTACSWWQLGPFWWFAGVLVMLGYFLMPKDSVRTIGLTLAAVAVLVLASFDATYGRGSRSATREIWSPYYRIHYASDTRLITVNLIGHQAMTSRSSFFPAYDLPHLFNRDSGRPGFAKVLVIGAGSGNDVSRALEWKAGRVDAVEIDPVIYGLGQRDHPDRPYRDPRVVVHLDDGRNYLRSTTEQYDLIVYALVDSLVLHSGYSNLRLESYLFTMQAFADIRKRLKPDGVFVMYNYFRQGWIVARLEAMLEATFGAGNPIVFNLPTRQTVQPEDVLFDEFTVMFAGGTGPLKEAFARHGEYWLRTDRASGSDSPNGFDLANAQTRSAWTATQAGAREADWLQFRPTTVVAPASPTRLASDDWPFLYLQGPMIPGLSLRGVAIMGAIAALFLVPFVRRPADDDEARPAAGQDLGFLSHMFFLGAGFMLIETKAVVHMALLFGSTWLVNSIVFCAMLLMILAANLFVLAVRPRSVKAFYIGLVVSLAANAIVPMDAFLGLPFSLQVVGSCLLVFTPVLFAGVIFAISFSRAVDAHRAFGANVAGAMAGGLSEYTSMLLGFQYVVLVALVFYGLSALGIVSRARTAAALADQPAAP